MHIARWALIGAALLAAFQAWLWAGQDSMLGLAGAIAVALALVAAMHLSGTRYAEVLRAEWQLPRAPGESERHYRFKIAWAWVVVVTLCLLACIPVSGKPSMEVAGVTLRVFGFVALLMALQSFLVGMFRPTGQAR